MIISERHLDRPERTGLFGGTFNPIHNGHVQAALDIRNLLRLDRLFFIPSAQPPHKVSSNLASAAHRLAMIELALQGHPSLEASDIEIRRGGRSYTFDTIKYFKQSGLSGRELFFLVGMDAFLEIDTWRESQQLFSEVNFVVMSRPPHNPTDTAWRAELEHYIGRHISNDYHFNTDLNRFEHPRNPSIFLARVTPVDISSSRIRTMVARGESIDAWVPEAVVAFIALKGLYQ
jgi:nicotinate-nucleotide adenylyltransferase